MRPASFSIVAKPIPCRNEFESRASLPRCRFEFAEENLKPASQSLIAFEIDPNLHQRLVPPISPRRQSSPSVYSWSHSFRSPLDKRLKQVLSSKSLSHTITFSGSSVKRRRRAQE